MLIDTGQRRQSSGLVVVERTERVPEPVTRDGVPVAPLDRAVIDATRCAPDLDAVRALIAEVVQRRRTTVGRLTADLDAGSQRGSAWPRQAIAEVEDGNRSASEGWARDVHRRSGLPPILWNPRLHHANGRFLASPDGFFDDVALAWEINLMEFHPDGDDATARRTADLVRAGVLVVGHRPRRLLTEPERVVEEVWSYYLLAATRPRPDIRVVPASGGSQAA